MGHIIKYIMGNESVNPKYSEWTIEQNADDKVHIHLNNIRIDLTKTAYNQLYDVVKQAHGQLVKS